MKPGECKGNEFITCRMYKDRQDMRVLVIEDNIGDFILIEEFLTEAVKDKDIDIVHVKTYKEASEKEGQEYDAILLDLSLPDHQGEELVKDIIALAPDIPVIVLTGYSDKEFGVKTLALGVSDYLLKDDLSSSQLYKSISYSIERKKINLQLLASEENYRHLFDLNPAPIWVFEIEALKIVNVNEAAIKHYGYSREEFYRISLEDLSLKEDLDLLNEIINKEKFSQTYKGGVFRQRKKNGEIIEVEIQSRRILFDGKDCHLVIITDVSERQQYVREIEEQNKIMREIAWTQSHVVRAPLARIMGLIKILEIKELQKEHQEVMKFILHSAHELDSVVRDIVRKTECVEKSLNDGSGSNNC